MPIAAVVLSVVLGLAMLASGTMKIIRSPRIVDLMEAVSVPASRLPLLGALQVASTVGLVTGIWFPPLGIAAAVGLVLYFGGAIIAHVRAHDPNWQGAASFLALSAATLIVLLLRS